MIEDNILIENAVLAFLHNYPDHKWVGEYQVLLDKLNTLKDAQPKTAEVRKRGRPAKRQRKAKASSNSSSESKDESTN